MTDLMTKPSTLVPPLQSGDRLTRAEFERRFDATPRLAKAELIRGVTYVAQPVSHDFHGRPHTTLAAWLGYYVDATPGLDQGTESSVRLVGDNEPQPDCFLRIPFERGGRSRVGVDGYLEGAPELIAEVAASSASYDLHDKLEVYRDNGVREYVVWRVLDREVDWFELREGRYERLAADPDGLVRSRVFPGLWLDVAALLRGDRLTLRKVVTDGTTTTEHTTFAARVAPLA